ncbi:hypothetical protein QVD17_14447 [Tagetes erecta]|uniref:Uncharacterized protein n=1 Tax=Tagetes erecta TaxID=13708 RepID=A0AAD8P3S7_TARER|nr:hypothetical protein QVD17_14447 [Tagetes erecta]
MEEINGKNKRKSMELEKLDEADLKSFSTANNLFDFTIFECKHDVPLSSGDLKLEDVVGPASLDNLKRREFVIHLKDVRKHASDIDMLLEDLYGEKTLKSIQMASGATIAIASYPEGRHYYLTRLELWGTDDQVNAAEWLIVNKTAKWYPESCVPKILMQAPFDTAEVYVPLVHVVSYMSVNDMSLGWNERAKIMEAQSGAWIKVGLVGVPGDEYRFMNVLKIFGSRLQIYRVLVMVHKAILEPYIRVQSKDQESATLEDENKQHYEAYVPLGQVSDSLLGKSFDKVKEVEARSGARIEVDQVVAANYALLDASFGKVNEELEALSGAQIEVDLGEGYLRMIRLKIHGGDAQIYQVLIMIHKAILEPYIPEDQEYAKQEEDKPHHFLTEKCTPRFCFTSLDEEDLKSFPANSNISASRRCYYLSLEGDLRFEDVVGPTSLDNMCRREFVVRLGDVQSDEEIKCIQKASAATIAIISSPEGRLYDQARLELWGTNDQVRYAELLIIKATTEWYLNSRSPTVLMQAPFGNTEVYLPLRLASLLLGYEKIVNIEAQSGAWIRMDSVEVPTLMKRFRIFGSPAQIYRALIMVQKAELELYVPKKTKDQESATFEDENQRHEHEVYVPLGQVSDSLLGANYDKVKEMEKQSGAKIEVHQLEDPGEGYLRMIRLKILGKRAEICQVLTAVHKATLEPYIDEDQVAVC